MSKKYSEYSLSNYLVIVLAGAISALNYELFIFPNNITTAGLNGILTIVQYVFNFSLGYMSLICNIPLVLIAYFLVDKGFAVKNAIYVVVFSSCSILLKNIDVSAIAFAGVDVGEKILAAVAAGIINGNCYSIAMKRGGSTGGTDIIARFVNMKHPEYKFIWIIFALNASVVLLSFFVFDMNYTPAILCIVYCFVTSWVSDNIIKGSRSATKFEIITKEPETLADEIMHKLKHGCTVVQGKGMYSGKDVSLLICVVNKMQLHDFEVILDKYKGSFVIESSVNGTYGNFKHIK